MAESRVHTLGEEIANSVTHGLGLALSVAALPVLVVNAMRHGDALRIASVAIFGATLVALYAASTLYHSIPHPRARPVLRAIDHSAIYLLIAGTYTPFALGPLRHDRGLPLLLAVWSLALAGILFRTLLGPRFHRVSVALYVAMGWMVVLAIRPMIAHIAAPGLVWLFAGGLAYTGGVAFYAWKRLPYGHMVWHLFVLAGSVCHFFAVLGYA
jgi:hemolysin III